MPVTRTSFAEEEALAAKAKGLAVTMKEVPSGKKISRSTTDPDEVLEAKHQNPELVVSESNLKIAEWEEWESYGLPDPETDAVLVELRTERVNSLKEEVPAGAVLIQHELSRVAARADSSDQIPEGVEATEHTESENGWVAPVGGGKIYDLGLLPADAMLKSEIPEYEFETTVTSDSEPTASIPGIDLSSVKGPFEKPGTGSAAFSGTVTNKSLIPANAEIDKSEIIYRDSITSFDKSKAEDASKTGFEVSIKESEIQYSLADPSDKLGVIDSSIAYLSGNTLADLQAAQVPAGYYTASSTSNTTLVESTGLPTPLILTTLQESFDTTDVAAARTLLLASTSLSTDLRSKLQLQDASGNYVYTLDYQGPGASAYLDSKTDAYNNGTCYWKTAVDRIYCTAGSLNQTFVSNGTDWLQTFGFKTESSNQVFTANMLKVGDSVTLVADMYTYNKNSNSSVKLPSGVVPNATGLGKVYLDLSRYGGSDENPLLNWQKYTRVHNPSYLYNLKEQRTTTDTTYSWWQYRTTEYSWTPFIEQWTYSVKEVEPEQYWTYDLVKPYWEYEVPWETSDTFWTYDLIDYYWTYDVYKWRTQNEEIEYSWEEEELIPEWSWEEPTTAQQFYWETVSYVWEWVEPYQDHKSLTFTVTAEAPDIPEMPEVPTLPNRPIIPPAETPVPPTTVSELPPNTDLPNTQMPPIITTLPPQPTQTPPNVEIATTSTGKHQAATGENTSSIPLELTATEGSADFDEPTIATTGGHRTETVPELAQTGVNAYLAALAGALGLSGIVTALIGRRKAKQH